VIVSFTAQLWQWDARRNDTWMFVTLPAGESQEIREHTAGPRRGFGSVRVRVTIGATTWQTSVFPEGEHYVLPVKRAVRTAEDLDVGDEASVRIELL